MCRDAKYNNSAELIMDGTQNTKLIITNLYYAATAANSSKYVNTWVHFNTMVLTKSTGYCKKIK